MTVESGKDQTLQCFRGRDIVLWCVLGILTAVSFTFLRHGEGELKVYRRAAQQFAAGEDIYRTVESGPFAYPPFFVVPFVPLAALPANIARAVFYFLNILMLGMIVRLIAWSWQRFVDRTERQETRTSPVGDRQTTVHTGRRWALVFVIAILAGRHAISPIEYQGHELIVFLLVMAAIVSWDAKQRWWPGFWIGLAAACKATPLLFLPVFLWQRKWLSATALAITMLGATLLPDAISRRTDGRMWAVAWCDTFLSKLEVGVAPDVKNTWKSWNILNQSLAGTVYRLSSRKPSSAESGYGVRMFPLSSAGRQFATIASILVVLLFVAFVTRRSLTEGLGFADRSFVRLAQGSVVLCAMLLLSPMSSKQHFCTLPLPISVICVDIFYGRRSLISLGAISVVFMLGTLAAKDVVGRPLGNTALALGSLTFCTLICLLAAGHIALRAANRAAARQQKRIDSVPSTDELLSRRYRHGDAA